jgi:hypothetical protein
MGLNRTTPRLVGGASNAQQLAEPSSGHQVNPVHCVTHSNSGSGRIRQMPRGLRCGHQ